MTNDPYVAISSFRQHLLALLPELEDALSQSLANLASPPARRTLSHYTTQTGVHGILTSNTIYATHPRYLNDSEETLRVREPLLAAFGNLKARYAGTRGGKVIERLRQTLLGEPWSSPAPARRVERVIACFCEEDDLLSQWRGYGGTAGPAYALTFGFDALQDLTVLTRDNDGHLRESGASDVSLVKVIYNPDEQRRVIQDLIALCVNRSITFLGKEVKDDGEANRITDVLATVIGGQIINYLSIRFKNPGFSEEKEWRLVARLLPSLRDAAPPSFRPTALGFAPYYTLGLPTFPSAPVYRPPNLPLTAVRQGPVLADPELGQESMEIFLRTNGYYRGVTTSGISYRPS